MLHPVSLMEVLNEQLACEQLKLPVFPPLVLQLQSMLRSEEPDIQEVSNRISEDQVLASQLLRTANSAFYSGFSKVTTIRESILRLGTEQVVNLVILATQEQQYFSDDPAIRPYFSSLWKHASACAIGSKWLAERLGYRADANEAFLSGLLHDIGNLFLLKVLENIKTSGKYSFVLSPTVLAEILETMHTTQGALLLERWNLPSVYCDVVRSHHSENIESSNTNLLIVRLIDRACHKLGIGLHQETSTVLAATNEAQKLEMSELLCAELEIMLEDTVVAA